MFLSYQYPGEPIIDESNAQQWAPDSDVIIEGENFSRGLILPEPKEKELERAQTIQEGYAAPWEVPVFSRDEIIERIKEREQQGIILSQLLQQKGVPTSNQDSTNYCWTYGVFSALNAIRCRRNMPYIEWSRESVAAPVKGYRNNGGWGDQALKQMVDIGPMPQDLWPRYHYRNSQYYTEQNLQIAGQYKVEEFLILQDRNFLQMMTALVLDLPVAVGYNWWRHEVCAVDPVIIGSNQLGARIWNSWGNSYGSNGYAILAESKATADDQVIPVVQMAT